MPWLSSPLPCCHSCSCTLVTTLPILPCEDVVRAEKINVMLTEQQVTESMVSPVFAAPIDPPPSFGGPFDDDCPTLFYITGFYKLQQMQALDFKIQKNKSECAPTLTPPCTSLMGFCLCKISNRNPSF